ncbi:MAG: hypothetical protein FWD74_04040 [Actinomycetia bacterium]|nr:hypothetical protein [Actinomycetes bacterium]
MSEYAWAWWLAAPIVATALAAALTWWRGRPRRARSTAESITAHRAFLDALGTAGAAEPRDARGHSARRGGRG